MSDPVAAWAEQAELDPVHVDCATAVMLKILDGKCKMNAREKAVMAVIYEVVKDRPGKLLDPAVHALIAEARAEPGDGILERVYEQRLLAETMISRPVMKGFKAMLRQEGIIGGGA
jgi:hypothetical protein